MVQLCYTILGLCVMSCGESKYGDKAIGVLDVN